MDRARSIQDVLLQWSEHECFAGFDTSYRPLTVSDLCGETATPLRMSRDDRQTWFNVWDGALVNSGTFPDRRCAWTDASGLRCGASLQFQVNTVTGQWEHAYYSHETQRWEASGLRGAHVTFAGRKGCFIVPTCLRHSPGAYPKPFICGTTQAVLLYVPRTTTHSPSTETAFDAEEAMDLGGNLSVGTQFSGDADAVGQAGNLSIGISDGFESFGVLDRQAFQSLPAVVDLSGIGPFVLKRDGV